MLSAEKISLNRLKYFELLSKLNIDLVELSKYLDQVDYFNKPATTQYIGAYPGGLCEYALRSAHELGVLCNAYFPGRYSEEDVIKVAFFKDIYKATMYEAYMKNVKDEATRVAATRVADENVVTEDSSKKETKDDASETTYREKLQSGFDRVIEMLKGIKDVNDEQKELASAQVEIATAGEIDDTEIKKKRGKSLGARIARKFNGLASILNLNKKKSRQNAEDAESITAREGTDKITEDIDDEKSSENETPVKEKSTLGKLWDKIKSGAIFGGSKIGGFILKGAKTAGIIGLLGGLGFTIAELIRPGVSEKIGAKIDAFTEYVTDDEFSLKKVFTDFSDWFNKSFIGKWWGENVKPWWDKEVIPLWQDTVLPGIKKIPEIIITGLPGVITNVGGLIATHADTIIDAFTTVITEIGVPLTTAIIKGTPAILGAVLEGSVEVLKSLGNEMLYLLGIKKRPTVDISDTTKDEYEKSGTQVATENVGSVSAGTIDEAIDKAKNEYGLSNPNVVYNPNTNKYDISRNIVTDKYTARDAKTGEQFKVGGIRSDQLTESTTRLATYGLGDAAFNLFNGRGKTGVKVAQTGIQAAATASGKVLQGTGWVGRKVLGKLPIVGIPFKAVGGAVQASGKVLESAAHPIQTAKTIKEKAIDNKLVNSLFGTPEFRAGKTAVSSAADAAEKNACTKLIAALGKIRQNTPALCYGEYKELLLQTTHFAYARILDGKSLAATMRAEIKEKIESLVAENNLAQSMENGKNLLLQTSGLTADSALTDLILKYYQMIIDGCKIADLRAVAEKTKATQKANVI